MTDSRDLLLHPVRLRIIQALIGQPMTSLEIKRRLGDVAQATLYRQIKLLAEGGLIRVVEKRQIRGSLEKTYGVVEEAAQLGKDQFSGATSEDHFQYFATFVGTLLADYQAYLSRGEPDFTSDRISYRQTALWLSDSEFDEMSGEIAVAMQARMRNQPSPGRRRRVITTVVMPDDRDKN